MSEPFRVGLLGHGTVGSAFDRLLGERAAAIAAATGRRPDLCGILTRSRGSFDEVLEGADAIGELIRGILTPPRLNLCGPPAARSASKPTTPVAYPRSI